MQPAARQASRRRPLRVGDEGQSQRFSLMRAAPQVFSRTYFDKMHEDERLIGRHFRNRLQASAAVLMRPAQVILQSFFQCGQVTHAKI